MNKKSLIHILKENNNGKILISQYALRMKLGIGQNKAADLVSGLQSFEGKYFIEDVAERLLERSERL